MSIGLSGLYSTFGVEGREGRFLEFWRDILRGFLGRRRGARGRFYREIPGVSGGARVRRGDSSARRTGAGTRGEKILKFLERGENPKIGVQEGREMARAHLI